MAKRVAEMSLQHIFDKAAVGMLRQNRRSGRDKPVHKGSGQTSFGCEYRGADGCKCAVGFLIHDDDYDPVIENVTIRNLLGGWGTFSEDLGAVRLWEALGKPDFDGERMDLLKRLQDIHDQKNLKEWKSNLKVLADDFNLSTKTIDKTKQGTK